jgi:hypothetical protein
LQTLHQTSQILDDLGIKWIITGFGILILLWLAHHLFGVSPTKIVRGLLAELLDLTRRRYNVGAINMTCVILTFIFGVLIILVYIGHHITKLIENIIGHNQAILFEKSTSLTMLFFGLLSVVIVSLLVIMRLPPPSSR